MPKFGIILCSSKSVSFSLPPFTAIASQVLVCISFMLPGVSYLFAGLQCPHMGKSTHYNSLMN